MTAEQIAQHLNARRAGRSRWMAKCPAHPDRMPSLSIGTGSEGRTLLNCHAGCSVDSILNASALSRRDLFAGPPLSKKQMDELAVKREVAEEEEQAEKAMTRSAQTLAIGQMGQLDLAVNFLAGRLMICPEDDSLAQAFDRVLSEFRRVESIASHLGVAWIGAARWSNPCSLANQNDPLAGLAQVFTLGLKSRRKRRRVAWVHSDLVNVWS
jgi:hypothetical protein